MSRAVMSLFVSLVFAQSTYGDHYGAGLAKSTTSASNPLKFYKFLAKYFPVQCQDQAVPTWSIMLIEEHHVHDTAPLSFFSRRTYMAHLESLQHLSPTCPSLPYGRPHRATPRSIAEHQAAPDSISKATVLFAELMPSVSSPHDTASHHKNETASKHAHSNTKPIRTKAVPRSAQTTNVHTIPALWVTRFRASSVANFVACFSPGGMLTTPGLVHPSGGHAHHTRLDPCA